jgi:hypothetical protein
MKKALTHVGECLLGLSQRINLLRRLHYHLVVDL